MFTELAVSAIRPSPINPRKTISEKRIDELAASIRSVGVLEPIMVRPLPAEQQNGITHELVFGERRWRAAQREALDFIPAMVRELTDREVLEIQLFENGEREDVSPAEQGRAYRRLHDEFEYSVEEIASRSGRSTKWVRERMSLGDLCPSAIVALEEEKLTLGVALLLSRMPPELQPEALKEMIEYGADGEMITIANAKDLLEREHMRPLGQAVFSITDAELVPSAGSCTSCPKRTGVQAELFADVTDTNTCTDSRCFREKNEAHWAQLQKSKAKLPMLSEADSKKAFNQSYNGASSLSYSSGFADANEKPWQVGEGEKTWKEILGKDFQPVLAKAPDGEIFELVPKSAIAKVTKQESSSSTPSGPSAAEKRRKFEEDLKRCERSAVFAALDVAAAKLKTKSAPKLAAVCALALSGLMSASRWKLEQVAKRRGVPLAELDKQPFSLGLLLECALVVDGDELLLDSTCKVFGINAKVIAGKAAKAFRTAHEEKRAKAKAKTASKAKPKKAAPLPSAKKAKGK